MALGNKFPREMSALTNISSHLFVTITPTYQKLLSLTSLYVFFFYSPPHFLDLGPCRFGLTGK